MADELDSSLFHNPQFVEAHACLRIAMRVTSIDPPSGCDPLRRPTIHFVGIPIGGGSNETGVEGMVCDEGEDVIRWSVSIIAHGEVEFQIEGAQIGGVQSAAGWVGCWTTPTHEPFDPAGPSWAYKIG